MGECLIHLIKILVRKPYKGYYVRWYYNGFHYYLFRPGQIRFVTEGYNFQTTGTTKLKMGSGQVTRGEMEAIQTIIFSLEMQLFSMDGWMNFRIEPGSFIIYDSRISGIEIEFTAFIGSKTISRTGFSPQPPLPLPIDQAQIFRVDENTFGFTYDEYGIGARQFAYLTIIPNRQFSMVLTYLDWATVTAHRTANKVCFYPNAENTGVRRDGVVTLTIPGKDPIYLAITQFEAGADQIFEADDIDHDFGWDEYGAGIAKQSILTIVPDQVFTKDDDISAWATIIMDQADNKVVVYPNAKNDGVELNGTIHLHCPDAADIDIAVTHFGIPVPDPPVATAGTDITSSSFYANWQESGLASGYRLDVSLVSNFATYVAGYQNLDVGDVLTKQVTGLDPETDYYFRVRAYNVNGTSANSNTIKTTTIPGVQSLTTAASNFVATHAAAYSPGGVIVTSAAENIIFTGNNGLNFTGNTTITNTSGDLDGTVENTQAYQAGIEQVATITLTGTNGSAKIYVGALAVRLATFDEDLTTTASNFVTANVAFYAANGIDLTFAVEDIIFTEQEKGGGFGTVSISNFTGNLNGTLAPEKQTEGIAAAERIDTITLTETARVIGAANITCDAVTRDVLKTVI